MLLSQDLMYNYLILQTRGEKVNMADIPDDSYDFMKASAEEWSKPEVPSPAPPRPETETDRWGAPVATPDMDDGDRWGSEKMDTSETPKITDFIPKRDATKPPRKFPWWVILIIVIVVVSVCVCLVLGILAVLKFFPVA